MTNDDLMLRSADPDEISYDDLDVKEVIGAGKLYCYYLFSYASNKQAYLFQVALAK